MNVAKKPKYISQEDILKAKVVGLPDSVLTRIAKKIEKNVHWTLLDEYCPENEEIDSLEWSKDLVRLLVEKNDKSLKFVIDQYWANDRDDYSAVYIDDPESSGKTFTSPLFVDEWADYCTGRSGGKERCLRDILNQIVLDFYGIDEHELPKLTKREAKAEIKEIDRKVKKLEGRIGRLKKKREWLASGEGVKK